MNHTDDVTWHLELFVPGRAAPQGSKNGFAIAKGRGANRVFTGQVAMIESSKGKVDAWRKAVRAAAAEQWAGRPALDGPLVLEVEFIRSRPKAAPKSYTPEHTTYPDVSKLVRSTEDAITSAGVWADDARVVRLIATKRNAEHDETPGAHIRIGRLTPARERWETERANRPAKAPRGPSDPKRPNEVGQTEPKRHRPAARSAAPGPAAPQRVVVPGNRENGSQSRFSEPTETPDLLEALRQSVEKRRPPIHPAHPSTPRA